MKAVFAEGILLRGKTSAKIRAKSVVLFYSQQGDV